MVSVEAAYLQELAQVLFPLQESESLSIIFLWSLIGGRMDPSKDPSQAHLEKIHFTIAIAQAVHLHGLVALGFLTFRVARRLKAEAGRWS